MKFAASALIIASLFAVRCAADIYPKSSEASEDLKALMSQAQLACRGEVLEAPSPKVVDGPTPRETGIAVVRIDKCYKGSTPIQINVLVDEFLPGGGMSGEPRFVILKPGEYDLFFLKTAGSRFVPLHQRGSVLTLSRRSSSTKSSDPLVGLEDDLVAGLQDPDQELVLQSIVLLGGLGHLHSAVRLEARVGGANELERDYIWEALLRVQDYSILPQVTKYLHGLTPPRRALNLPQDRLLLVQNRLFGRLFEIKDPVANSYQQQFTKSTDGYIRQNALQALRAQENLQNTPHFLAGLADTDFDTRFISMMALIELAGGGDIPWVKPYDEMRDAPDLYASKCREWWAIEGAEKAKSRNGTRLIQ